MGVDDMGVDDMGVDDMGVDVVTLCTLILYFDLFNLFLHMIQI